MGNVHKLKSLNFGSVDVTLASPQVMGKSADGSHFVIFEAGVAIEFEGVIGIVSEALYQAMVDKHLIAPRTIETKGEADAP